MGKINELTGETFGRLEVIRYEGVNNHRKATWLCRCQCGNTKVLVGSSLISGSVVSCGCFKNSEAKRRFSKDITNKKYGKLTVINREGTHITGRSKLALWRCECDCGEEVVVRGASLRNGSTKSCGCAQRANSSIANSTHGLSKTKIYRSWASMKKRCHNPNDHSYHYYGNRGIRVCEEWYSDFTSFYRWAVQNGYEEDLTLDRINVNGNYEPTNCRWITQKEQSNNTRRNKFYFFKGNNCTLSQISDDCNIPYSVLYKRLKRGWNLEEATTVPVRDIKK